MDNVTTLQKTSLPTKQEFNEGMFDRFINFLDASPKTVETYTRAIRQFVKYIAGNEITAPTRADVLAYREFLKQTCKPSTVQNYITVVKVFFKWTAQEGLYPNIAEHIKGSKISREHKKDYLTAQQVKSIISGMGTDNSKELRDKAIMLLMITGALRTIEIVRANVEDIRTTGEYTALYIQGKGREEKAEYVKLMPEVEQAIRQYLLTRKDLKPESPLFVSVSNHGMSERMTTRSVSRIVKTAFVSAGYNSPTLTAHSTRHTAVTLALMGGESLEEVKTFARHRNVETTLIYAHNIDRAKSQCEQTIASMIF